MNSLYPKSPSQRQLSISSSIQKIVSTAFTRNEIYHPDLEDFIISFPFVKVTADLRSARIYVDCLERDLIIRLLSILNSLKNEIRYIIGSKLNLRYVPEIEFIQDEISKKQANVLNMIDKIAQN